MKLDVGIAALLSLVIIQVSLASIWLSESSTASMIEYAQEQRSKIVLSDYLMARYGTYDEHCRSTIPQTIGNLPERLRYNISLRRLGESSNASGVVIRRLVFLGERRKENERLLEIW